MVVKSLRTLVELAVFVPVGLATELRQAIPRLVESGRDRVEGRIAVARVIGEMAVRAGVEQVRARPVNVPADVPATVPVTVPVTVPGEPGSPVEVAAAVVEAPSVAAAARHEVTVTADGDESVDPQALPIVDYESLAASQVVARLPALSTRELDQVAEFEQANRRRRTVLGKIDQLQRA